MLKVSPYVICDRIFFHVESIVVNVFFLGCFQLWDRVKKKMFLRFLGELDVS